MVNEINNIFNTNSLNDLNKKKTHINMSLNVNLVENKGTIFSNLFVINNPQVKTILTYLI